MRVGLFGDVHGNVEALGAVLAALRGAGCEALLCAGDLVNYGPDPEAAAEMALEAACACVAGNHDLAAASGDGSDLFDRPGRDGELERACFAYTLAHLPGPLRRRLAGLPRTVRWPRDGGWLLLAHGSPDDPGEYVTEQVAAPRRRALAAQAAAAGAAWLCLGHTHLPMLLHEGGTAICNAGSVGWPKDGDWRASCAVIDDGGALPGRPGGSPGGAGGEWPGDPTGERPGEAAGERPGEPTGGCPGEAAVGRPGQRAEERPGDPTAGLPGEPTGERPGEAAGGRPGQRTGERPVEAAGGSPSFRVLRVPYDVERTLAGLRRAGLPERLGAAVAAGRASR